MEVDRREIRENRGKKAPGSQIAGGFLPFHSTPLRLRRA